MGEWKIGKRLEVPKLNLGKLKIWGLLRPVYGKQDYDVKLKSNGVEGKKQR